MNSVLKNKNIVVGITGSIAAYKAVEIIRLLRKKEAIIYPVMTRAATYFVHPLTFQTLSSQRVTRKMFKEEKKEIPHLSLAKLADLLLIAPATANIIGKIANGIADDILTTTVLATRAPVVIAPAMNYRMFRNPIFQTNMNKLKTFGFKFIGPEKGVLASGEAEIGRMVDPPRIVEYLEKVMNSLNDFQGKSFLITAGPTREPLDEVRFFSNYSSGKMGYALAEEGISRGAKIILISGPTFLTPPAKAEFYLVESAKDMEKKVMDNFSKVDGVFMVAAVADYRPEKRREGKIKKDSQKELTIKLVQNPDILKELGERKKDKILIGFCAEVENIEEEAKKKLKEKNLDLIVANDITLEGAGFEEETNIVTLIDKNGKIEYLAKRSKREIAVKIWDKVKNLLEKDIS